MRNFQKLKGSAYAVAFGGRLVLYSYNAAVAVKEGARVLVTEKRWSKTTSRHVSEWVKEQQGAAGELLYVSAVSQAKLDDVAGGGAWPQENANGN